MYPTTIPIFFYDFFVSMSDPPHPITDYVPEETKNALILRLMNTHIAHRNEGRDLRTSWRYVDIPRSLLFFSARLLDGSVVSVTVLRSYYDVRNTSETIWIKKAMRRALVRIVDMAVDLYHKDEKWSKWNLAAVVARLLDQHLDGSKEEVVLRAHLVYALAELSRLEVNDVLDSVEHLYEDDTAQRNLPGRASRFLQSVQDETNAARTLRESNGRQRPTRGFGPDDRLRRRLNSVGKRIGLPPASTPTAKRRRLLTNMRV